MKTTQIVIGIAIGLALGAAYGGAESKPANEPSGEETALLWTFKGNYKMTPSPTLYSNSLRIKLQKVELLQGPNESVTTKITYSPWYGKIESESHKFVTAHEPQTVTLLLGGDHTAKVKEGDILRTCFYPN
jgi:hypothetical protein